MTSGNVVIFVLCFVVSATLRLPGIIHGIENAKQSAILRSSQDGLDLSLDDVSSTHLVPNESSCKPDTGDDDSFPPFFTEEQLLRGGIVLCFLIGIYCFTLLALVCDKYFLPSIECLCEALDLSADVAAATFMSVATSCPEMFTNIIATFITDSKLGIGTIIGSSMYNSLGVAAIGGLAASQPIQLDWWPVTRDVFIYLCSISLLVGIVWDGYIFWYEGLMLFIAYFVYMAVVFQNPRMSRIVRKLAIKYKKAHQVSDSTIDIAKEEEEIEQMDRARVSVVSAYGSYMQEVRKPGYENSEAFKIAKEAEKEYSEQEKKSPFVIPRGGLGTKIWFFYSWPIKMTLRCTMPNPKLHPKLFPITFLICIVWIGLNSYMVSWMITLIGVTFNIPSTVQGLTLSAAGSSLPESLSIAIMSRRGEGKMGVSNSLGANSMNILFSLGMPWFFKTIFQGTIDLGSSSIIYTIMGLVVVALILYATLFLNKFQLRKRTGYILLSIYLVCIVLACLNELLFFNKC